MVVELNFEVKKLWIGALESDEYKQGTRALSKVGPTGIRRDCCLGVLCSEAAKLGVIPPPKWIKSITGNGQHAEYGKKKPEDSILPQDLLPWMYTKDTLRDNNLIVLTNLFVPNPKTGYLISLAALNDRGMSFAEIKEIIRKEF